MGQLQAGLDGGEACMTRRSERGRMRRAMHTPNPIVRLAPLVAALILAISAGACANKELQPDGANLAGRGGPATPGSQRDFAQNVGDIVYFSTDSTDLTPEAQQTLVNQGRWLQQYAHYTITI